MSVGVNPPKTPVTRGSNGIAQATLPNTCKMPGPPAPFVPTPLPNIGKSRDSPQGYTTTVKVEGEPVAISGASFGSMGDMASKGTGGGLVSANTHGPCKFIGPGSMDVKFEGKNVQLLSDPVTNNGAGAGSPSNSATMNGVTQVSSYGGDTNYCPICGKAGGHPIPNTRASAVVAERLAANAPPKYTRPTKRKPTPEPAGYMVGALVCVDPKTGLKQVLTQASGRPPGGFPSVPPQISGWPQTGKTAGGREMSLEDKSVPGSNKGGMCAGAKLVLAANEMGLKPVAMTEVWSGPSNRNFQTGQHAQSCDTCQELLPALLCDRKPVPREMMS